METWLKHHKSVVEYCEQVGKSAFWLQAGPWYIFTTFLGSFFQTKNVKYLMFQLIKCEDFLLFFVFCDGKLNIFGLLDCWLDRTRLLGGVMLEEWKIIASYLSMIQKCYLNMLISHKYWQEPFISIQVNRSGGENIFTMQPHLFE